MRYTNKNKRRRVSNKRISGRNKTHKTRRHNHHKRKRILRGGVKKEGIIKNCLIDKSNCYYEYDGDLNTSGKFHGNGTLHTYYATADNNKGEWIDTYEGSFNNGSEHGEGISTRPTRIFIGTWVNGKREGKGTIMLNTEVPHPGIDNYRIDGIWENDLLISGKYTKNFSDGTRAVYVGDINNDKEYHGFGKCSWYDVKDILVKSYDGKWRNHKMNGPGKMTTYNKDGTISNIQEGIWDKDEFSQLQTATSIMPTKPRQSSHIPSLAPPPRSSNLSRLPRVARTVGNGDE